MCESCWEPAGGAAAADAVLVVAATGSSILFMNPCSGEAAAELVREDETSWLAFGTACAALVALVRERVCLIVGGGGLLVAAVSGSG